MSFVNDESLPSAERATFGRRDVLRIGGVTFAAGAVLAACGTDPAEGPLARVGDAPTTTRLPEAHVTDSVLLRTVASLELSLVEVYDKFDELGVLSGDASAAANRFRRNHLLNANAVNALIRSIGGEEWTCSNQRFDAVVVAPILNRIEGTGTAVDGTPIEPSDDPTRDALNTINALESVLASTHQSFVPQLHDPVLRSELMVFGEQEARHAAVIALIANPDEPIPVAQGTAPAPEISTTTSAPAETPAGVPEAPGQASEDTTPEEATADAEPPKPHAIPGQFGNLGVTQLVVGAPSAAGTRYTANIETASLNSYVYDFQECSA